MKKNILQTILQINKILQDENVTFAFGASNCLFFNGIDVCPNDIDILVTKEDLHKLKNCFKNFKQLEVTKSDVFLSKYFYKYELNGCSIDVMCEFTIKKGDFVYVYPFGDDKIDYAYFRKNKIPVSPIEDWRYLYSLMPNREEKVKMIDEYLK